MSWDSAETQRELININGKLGECCAHSNKKTQDEVVDEAPSPTLNIEDPRQPLIYKITQSPPFYLALLFALQQSLLNIDSPVKASVIVSEVICGTKDDVTKTQILSATFLMSGISTFLMTTVGVRLPIFQGPSVEYLIPLLSMATLDEWKCPKTFEEIDPNTNRTILMARLDNNTAIPNREIVYDRIQQLSGSLMVAGSLHFLIGLTGLVGVIIRYVGPITLVPTIIMVGLQINKLVVKFSETNWPVAVITAATSIVLALYLANRKTPIPLWTRSKGFHILWFPLHQVFALLISVIVGWTVSAIMTKAGALSDDPESKQWLARTDSRLNVIEESDFFTFPYPGRFGMISFTIGGFISFFLATILSILDSIGDYNASARTARAPPPPRFAFNRGIAIEGFMSLIAGTMGCCHATASYGGNIGAMGMTRVVSRRVFQLTGIIYVLFAVLGKFGAVFITIPYAVLGGTSLVAIGIFIGVILSYLQTVNLSSMRNLAIIGIALLLGLMMPHWVKENPDALNTGNHILTTIFKMLLTNASIVSGLLAFVLDNTVPGTLRERGLLAQMKNFSHQGETIDEFEEAVELYELPFLPKKFSSSKFAKYIPIFKYNGPETQDLPLP